MIIIKARYKMFRINSRNLFGERIQFLFQLLESGNRLAAGEIAADIGGGEAAGFAPLQQGDMLIAPVGND